MALLKVGSTGDDVKKLQQQLKDAGFDPGGIDGIYGNKTAAAITAYQKANNLTVDGIAGNQTLGSLNKPATPTSIAAPVSSANPTQTAADKKIAELEYQWGPLSSGYADAIRGGTESQYLQNVQNTVNNTPVESKPSVVSNTNSGNSNNSGRQNTVNYSYEPVKPASETISDDEWRKKAENYINPLYEMEKLATQQKYESLKKAMQDNLASIDPTYDKLVDRTKEQYQDTKNMVNNETLSRGMGRSSYVVDKLTDVGNKESQAVGDINAERTSKINEIGSTVAMYEKQLADSLAQMDISKASKIAAKMDDLKQYYDSLKLQYDQFNLQKQGQEFNQNMQLNQYDLDKLQQQYNQYMQNRQFDYGVSQDALNRTDRLSQQEIDNQYRQQVFDYNKDMDMRNFTYQQTQDKIDNAYKNGQLSLSQRNAALSEAKFISDNDPNSLDNQYKQLQILNMGKELSGNTSNYTNEQINYYDQLKDIYYNGSSYKDNPQAAYDWLTSPKGEQQNKTLVGDALYKRLVNDVASRIKGPVDTSSVEKTIMDLVKNADYPTALSYIFNTNFTSNANENEMIQLSLINKYNLGQYMK